MRITILTVSGGDIQPFIALGLGLQQAGHEVKLATHAAFKSLISNRGLNFAPVEGNPLAGEAGQALLESSGNLVKFSQQYARVIKPQMQRALADSFQACQETDVIISAPLAFWGYDIAEKLGLPFYLASLNPLSPTQDFPIPSVPTRLQGRFYNQLSYQLVRLVFWQNFHKVINHWRRSNLNLPPVSLGQNPLGRMDQQGVHFLYGYSPAVLPKPASWQERLHVTGYWFLNRATDWTPPQDLVDFLASGLPPVYIGFGSMNRNPEVMTNLVLSALAKTGQRGILQTGWGGISNADLPDSVFKLESIPHDWLFPQMAAVVHHGSVGITAAGLRAGVPSIGVPFFADQWFWGERVAQLGVGTRPIPVQQLTGERLAAAIQTAINNKEIGSRAAALSQKIQAEDGVRLAVKAFHQHLPT